MPIEKKAEFLYKNVNLKIYIGVIICGNESWGFGHDRSSPCATASFINTLRPSQDGRLFVDDIFKCMFLNANIWISIKISLKFVPNGPINTIPALAQKMAWCWPGDKSLSEPRLVSLLKPICFTRPQWVILWNIRLTMAERVSCSLYTTVLLNWYNFGVFWYTGNYPHRWC